jgi:RecA/RadA recombinase
MPVPASIVDLRQLLRERLPRARLGFAPVAPRAVLATGVPALDAALEGGLPVGETAELTGTGTAEVLHALLRQAAADGRFVALVDGVDSFDADAAEPAELARLLWVRCRTAAEAVAATDLLLRDRNFPLVVLDLKLNPAAELRRLSGSVWHRFGRLREQHRTTLLVLTAQPFVNGATVRVQLRRKTGLEGLEQSVAERLAGLDFTVLRQQLAGGEESLARTA